MRARLLHLQPSWMIFFERQILFDPIFSHRLSPSASKLDWAALK
jgi:hypothetical protein